MKIDAPPSPAKSAAQSPAVAATLYPRLIMLLGAAFFTSGFCALLYQVVWERMLGLFSGSDVRSVTIVTGAYLGGLGVGSLIASIYADRLSSRQAVQAYGICNLIIAAFALFSRFLYYDILFRRLAVLADSPLIMLITIFASLLIPTTLMGLSLPLLSKALVRSVSGAARLISRLYGVNTMGAGAGALISGWYLIGTLGYDRSLYVGAVLSALVGVIAIIAARRFDINDGGTTASVPATTQWETSPKIPGVVWMWCAFVFVSGFMVISLELIWFRLLDFVLKSNAYTFGHLLAFFLVSDAAGSLVGSRYLNRIRNPRQAFLRIQGAVALYALISTWVLSNILSTNSILLQYSTLADGRTLLSRLQSGGADTLPTLVILVMVYGVLPLLILVPPSFLVGFYFPIVQKAIQTDTQVVGQRVGMVEVANILGNTAGSILTGVLLLHLLGTANSLRLIGLMGLTFLAILLYENRQQIRVVRNILGQLRTVAPLGLLAVVVITFPSREAFWASMHNATQGLYFRAAEDASGIAALRGDAKAVEIWANGRAQGSVHPFDAFHSFLGVLPSLTHPQPKRVLVVGIGSGNTPYAVGINQQTTTIDAVEIVGSELDVLAQFKEPDQAQAVRKLFEDQRYRLIVGDGRREIALATSPYDVIVVDAVLPWTSHAGLLYSQEFFEATRNALADGGLMVEWRPTDRSEAGFLSVYPYVTIVGDIVMIGSNKPIAFDSAQLWQRLTEPQNAAYLKLGGADPEQMRYWIQNVPIQQWTPDSPRPSIDMNTDLFPKDEHYLNNALGTIRYPAAGRHWFSTP